MINKNFFNNIYEDITLENLATFKNVYVHNGRSSGYFHKYSKNKLSKGSNFLIIYISIGIENLTS